MEIILGQNRIEIEIDDNKITGISKKELHKHDDEIVVICEDDDYFANVFSSSEGGYAIYWYQAKDLEQFLKGDGEIELEEVDGAHCTGKIIDTLLWAYCQE
ncbi:MAG: hypothetical protein RBT59_00330 [Arcobacteraceae bacterium]|jgi:hypothetical protein|nr:hypothetical protein [Arcobacteraceae bacterium]